MKVKDIINVLKKVELTEYDILSATASFKRAEEAAKGIFWVKLKGRLRYASKIARKLKWQDNRLLDIDLSLKKYDVAPMKNITCNGDNTPWVETPEGGRPVEDVWLDTDPSSEEYKSAVASCYWSKGNHPRSLKARKAWYRRNAGEFHVYSLGEMIDPHYAVRTFNYEDKSMKAMFLNSGVVWQAVIEKKLFWKLWTKTRVGYEIDNVIREDGVQLWYPIEGYTLKAPVTKSTLPFWRSK